MSNVRKRRKSGGADNTFVTVCLCLAAVIALYKRIKITDLIGDNGNAYFGMAYDTYLFLFLITGYSLQNVLAKTVAARYSIGQYRNTKRVWNVSLLLVLISGIIAGGLQYLGAGLLAKGLFASPQAVPAIEYMAPLILISSLLGMIRGYFQGMGTMVPTAISRIIEEGAGLGVLFFMTEWTMKEGEAIGNLLQNREYKNAFGAGGAGLALSVGSAAAFLCLLLLYALFQKNFKRWERKDNGKETEDHGRILNVILGGMFPVMLLGFFALGGYILDQLLYFLFVPDSAEKIIQWGIYTGKYRILAGIPAAIVFFVSCSIMPGLGGSKKNRNIQLMIRSAVLYALPLAAYLGIMADTLIPALFETGDLQTAAGWLRYGCAAVLLQSLGLAFACVLCGTDRIKALLISAAAALAVHVISLILFLTKMNLGIPGVIYSLILLYGVFAVMNLIFVIMDLNGRTDWGRIAGVPIISTAVSGLVVFFMNTLLSGKVADGALIFLTLFVGTILYLVMVLMQHGISERDTGKLPFGNIIVIIGRTLHML